MGTTALKQLLRSLCVDSPWKYAVLWKLRYQSQRILTLEDGYCDYLKPRGPAESRSNHIFCTGSSELIPLPFGTSIHDGSSAEYPIAQVVADMSCLQYTLGEGVVGQVAYTGNHCWFLYDNIFMGDINCNLVSECPDEWLLQFASGIKTIVLVPVSPQGVVQLGSLEMIAEDLALVAYIKDRFVRHNGYGVYNFQLNNNMLSTLNQIVSLHVQDSLQISGEGHLEICRSAEREISAPPLSLSEVSTPSSNSVNDSQLEMVERKLLGLSCTGDLQANFQGTRYNVGVYDHFASRTLSAGPAGHLMEELFMDINENDTAYKSLNPFLSFPKECELHKALGPAFQRQTTNSFFSEEETCSRSGFICNRDLSVEASLSAKEGDAEYLLEAVVAKGYNSSDHPSDQSHDIKSATNFSYQFAASSQPQIKLETNASFWQDSDHSSRVASASIPCGTSSLTATASFKSMTSTDVDRHHLGMGCNDVHPQKGQKPSKISKRRARPGDNQRPRPRDRQMIQDRVKELRELVPNGSKCSIDSLLDRTIKHMLYLRSVTDQAAKLKQWAHQKVTVRKNLRSSQVKSDYQTGTSWAFELGNELQACPIFVEDLAHPGHMLIEMLCNEPSLFLEIAQVIRSLDLTILKGVMESHADNTWAHFIVEATNSFHRLDIFWPLMQLLQRKRSTISSRI